MDQEETVRKMVTARQLARLSKKERQEVLEAASALAEKDYRGDPKLTAFEAFGEEDFHDETE